MSESAVVPLAIDQGADYSVQIYWTDAGNNPFTVLHPMRMDIRASTGQLIYSLTSDSPNTEEQPNILYNSDSGLIQLTIPSSATAGFASGEYSYDLFVTYSDEAVGQARSHRLIRGSVYVYGRVTRDD